MRGARGPLSVRADVQRRRVDGVAALTVAALSGSLPALQMLLEAKADVHAADWHGQPALSFAALYGHAQGPAPPAPPPPKASRHPQWVAAATAAARAPVRVPSTRPGPWPGRRH